MSDESMLSAEGGLRRVAIALCDGLAGRAFLLDAGARVVVHRNQALVAAPSAVAGRGVGVAPVDALAAVTRAALAGHERVRVPTAGTTEPAGGTWLALSPLHDRMGRRIAWLVAEESPPTDLGGPTPAPDPRAAALDVLGHAVLVHRGFRPLYANQSCAVRLGFADATALSRRPTVLPYLPLETQPRAVRMHGELLHTGVATAPRWVRCIAADGAPYWIEATSVRVEWAGEPAELVSMSDVTAQAAARGNERLLREAIDNLADSFVLYDARERVVLANRRFHEIFPFFPPPERIVGTSMVDLVRLSIEHGVITDPAVREDPEGWLERYVAWRRENDSTLTEDSWPDGRWDLVKEQHTLSGGFVSVRTDITERKRAEFALRDSETRLEQALAQRTSQLQGILENIAEGVTVIDAEQRVVLINRGYAQLYDLPEHLVRPGMHVRELVRHRLEHGRLRGEEPELGVDADGLLERRLEEYARMTHEVLEERLDNGRVIEIRRRRLPDGHILSTFTDVTEQRAAQAELERQRTALYQSEKMSALGTLLAGVAHELNNPLSVVIGHAAMLEDHAADAASARRAGALRAAAERCARIVKTFLTMARRRPATRTRTAIAPVLDQVLDLVGYQLRSADVRVERDLDASLPEVAADPDQLGQVLLNLVVNAQQAMLETPGPRRLRIGAGVAPDRATVAVTVSDTGPGVPEAIRSRIFEPFFTTKPAGVGTGIGLALSHAMVEAHGGHIEVVDAPGGGARFTLTLPVATAAVAADEPARVVPASGVSGRVLVVDDEADLRDFLCEVLRADGFEVVEAADGAAALRRLGEQPFDVVVCDLRMPVMDGPRLYAAVRERDPRAAAGFVFVTGDLLSGTTERFLAGTGRPYIEKPVTPARLRAVVREVVAGANHDPSV
ncbi:MAG: PAS-domain containing protein [Ectothiorhodospiraceae bacterium]|nr:PAS-domain containing protein [Ectothiorhodospiraceae bacterium]